MSKKLALFLTLSGCAAISNPSTPPVAPVDAAIAVKVDLSMAVENAGVDEAVAQQSWARAYDMFELQIEPEIRQQCGRRRAAEIEYAFGTVRASLQEQADTQRAVEQLQVAIDSCMKKMTRL